MPNKYERNEKQKIADTRVWKQFFNNNFFFQFKIQFSFSGARALAVFFFLDRALVGGTVHAERISNY